VTETLVRVADARIGSADTVLVTLGLGSCVAIILHDAAAKIGGMAHVLLPSATLSRDRTNPARFPETAVPHLVRSMAALGATPEKLRARLVGGASMFANLASPGVAQMGERNVLASKDALKAARVPLVGEDTGNDYGRSVWFFVGEGRVEVRSVQHGTRQL
jgi:chemotaxis protein CheD